MFKEDSASTRIKRVYRDYLGVKQYNKIKVSEIIKAADVNRSSFYRHFDDVYSLYTEVCDDLINVILLEMPVASDTSDLRQIAEDALHRALTFVEEIKLLAGKHGNIQFLYRLRNAYFEALKTNAVKNGLWNDDILYMSDFAADYLTLSLSRIIMEEEISFPDLSAIDYEYDFSADPVDNVSEALRVLNGGRRDTQAAFLVSLIRRFSTGDQRAKPVTELFSSTGFSRAEFYKLYSHKSDYFSKLENALYLIVVKGVVPLLEADDPTVLTAAKWAHAEGVPVVLNPAPAAKLPRELYRCVDWITPNETEAELLTGVRVTDAKSAAKATDVLKRRGVGHVLITMGVKGVFCGDCGKIFPAKRVKAVDCVAAGDTFNGAFVVALAEGRSCAAAIAFAQKASAISVTRPGAQASVPHRKEIK